MIDKLPSELELLAQLDIDYIMEDQGKLVMETKITIYDDGADDLYDPDPYYGDTYDITKTLRKKS